ISQDKLGIKFKLAGDLIYGDIPQISAGAIYSHLRDPAIARAVGARDTHGTEFYVSAARVWLDGFANRSTLLNINVRYSAANQYGLLGFNGDDQDSRWHLEAAAALFITRNLAIGA